VQREKRGRAQRLSAGEPGPRNRESEGERAGEVTGADRLVQLGSERAREGARERELPLTGGVRLSGGTGARPGWLSGPTGPLSPFLFL
jgi:hypothetical protein